jgi:pimeloyl-ACP methyl ester carboxylesterase
VPEPSKPQRSTSARSGRPTPPPVRTRSVALHGHRVSFREAGTPGTPLVLLLHGIAGSSGTWEPVLERLGRHLHVIAPDMLGHGASAKPRGDYSLGAYAGGLRDLLAALGHERATVVGHSLGGGVAMQFAYHSPELVERLVLVSSGGLGKEVSPALRAATLPGAEAVLPVIAHHRLIGGISAVVTALQKLRLPLRASPGLREWARHYASLSEAASRSAFVHTARSVIDFSGQRVNASDRLYLAKDVPSLLVWGGRDPIIPAEHGRSAAENMPGSQLEIFESAGHFPHSDEPVRFAELLVEFVESTEPARLDLDDLRQRLVEAARAEDEAIDESGKPTVEAQSAG